MIYAKHHVKYRGKRYLPGKALPDGMTDKEWERLQRLGAIETVHDPVEVVLEDEQEDSGEEDTRQEDSGEEGTGGAPHQPAAPAVSPQREASDKTDNPPPPAGGTSFQKETEVKKAVPGKTTKRGGKKVKADEAGDLDAIAAANTVVEK